MHDLLGKEKVVSVWFYIVMQPFFMLEEKYQKKPDRFILIQNIVCILV